MNTKGPGAIRGHFVWVGFGVVLNGEAEAFHKLDCPRPCYPTHRVIPAKAGIPVPDREIPAFAGMTPWFWQEFISPKSAAA